MPTTQSQPGSGYKPTPAAITLQKCACQWGQDCAALVKHWCEPVQGGNANDATTAAAIRDKRRAGYVVLPPFHNDPRNSLQKYKQIQRHAYLKRIHPGLLAKEEAAATTTMTSGESQYVALHHFSPQFLRDDGSGLKTVIVNARHAKDLGLTKSDALNSGSTNAKRVADHGQLLETLFLPPSYKWTHLLQEFKNSGGDMEGLSPSVKEERAAVEAAEPFESRPPDKDATGLALLSLVAGGNDDEPGQSAGPADSSPSGKTASTFSTMEKSQDKTPYMYLAARFHPGLDHRPILARLRRQVLGPEMENESDVDINTTLMEYLLFEESHNAAAVFKEVLRLPYVTIAPALGISHAISFWSGGDIDDMDDLYTSLRHNQHNRATMGKLWRQAGPLDADDTHKWNQAAPGMTFALPLALPILHRYLDLSSGGIHVLLCFGRLLGQASVEVFGKRIVRHAILTKDSGFFIRSTFLKLSPFVEPGLFATPNCLILCSASKIDPNSVDVVAHTSSTLPAKVEKFEYIEAGQMHGLVLGYHLNYAARADVNGREVEIRSWSSRTTNVVGIRQLPVEYQGGENNIPLIIGSKWHARHPECSSTPLAEYQIVRISSSSDLGPPPLRKAASTADDRGAGRVTAPESRTITMSAMGSQVASTRKTTEPELAVVAKRTRDAQKADVDALPKKRRTHRSKQKPDYDATAQRQRYIAQVVSYLTEKGVKISKDDLDRDAKVRDEVKQHVTNFMLEEGDLKLKWDLRECVQKRHPDAFMQLFEERRRSYEERVESEMTVLKLASTEEIPPASGPSKPSSDSIADKSRLMKILNSETALQGVARVSFQVIGALFTELIRVPYETLQAMVIGQGGLADEGQQTTKASADTKHKNVDAYPLNPSVGAVAAWRRNLTLETYLRARIHTRLVIRPAVSQLLAARNMFGPGLSDTATPRELLASLVESERVRGVAHVFRTQLKIPFVRIEKDQSIQYGLWKWCGDQNDVQALYESVTENLYNQSVLGNLHGLDHPMDKSDERWCSVDAGTVLTVPLALPICCSYLELTRGVHVLLCFGHNLSGAAVEIAGAAIAEFKVAMSPEGWFSDIPAVVYVDTGPVFFSTPQCLIICSSHKLSEDAVEVLAGVRAEADAVLKKCLHLDDGQLQGLALGYHLDHALQASLTHRPVQIKTWRMRTSNVLGIAGIPDGAGGPRGLKIESKWHNVQLRPECCSYPLESQQIVRILKEPI